ncbi:chromosome partitioning protein ParB [Superficieibacter electus]|uniref:Chromosome partitioning protein ParB n=1 Tax=Superficieibacter electus TaxID=2022662 RepID=A0A2P5GVG3_9ENTR|nr:chromosome partitioning protein ParB [Superficieibacter electus]POP42361.1 chromosome partitioning protein ParB [Superficieibacter electus]POP50550.1 chromosome partitioning protein ParB [Superficieibacter electus]
MANSFKQMIKSGLIKRTDSGMFISPNDIHVKPDFNRRDDDDRTRRADDELFNFLLAGGTVPPLETVARDDGGVWIVEGHRRYRCYLRCRDAGKPVERIQIIPFVGNDVERIARIMTSNNQLSLTPIEQAAVVRDLAAFNLTAAEIAKLVHKSTPTVEKLLTLSTADHDVQQAVKSGEVSVGVALERMKEHGEKAGAVIEQDKAAAAAAGRKKVTKAFIAPEISIKKARRLVELLALADISDEGVIALKGLALAEVLEIIDEQKKIAADRSRAAA